MSHEGALPRTAEVIRAHVVDRSPQPFDESEIQRSPTGVQWMYGEGQYELALLARLIDDGFAANRHVHYTRNYGRIAVAATFRAAFAGPGSVRLRVSGDASVTVNGRSAELAAAQDGYLTFECPAGQGELRIEVVGSPVVVPAIAVDSPIPVDPWTASLEGGPWAAVGLRAGGDVPPHLEPASTVLLTARHNGDGVFDVGAPVLGRPILPEGPPPIIATGESVDEALSDPSTHETRHDVVQLPDGRWTTRHRLGFRYLIVDAPVAPSEIDIEASVLDVARPGAFACSDEQLTRIWAAAQYTLRTCSQGLLVDGIKRDRMPWAGDQAMSTLANAFALGEGGLVADGLVALGQPGHGYVNGIADYSLWWVVNADLYVRYFDDKQFVERSADLVHSFVTDLAQYADDQGVFRPVKHPGGFADAGPGSVFIDWGVTLEQGRDSVALQMLWFWALRSAERVLRRVAHDGADRWSDLADRLETTLRTRGWTSAPGRWSDYLDSAAPSAAPYANFLAILAGLHPSPPSGVHDAARRHDAGTPFMNALRLRALIHAGSHDEVLDEIRRVWGGMLDRGPGTFWEEVTTDGDPHSMYGRPFGRSLCHAWSAGPAAIIPEAVLGVAPLADGWAEFSVDTHLGDLEWASLVIPAPAGDIVVVAEAARVSVEFPGGTTLVHADGHRVEGPAHITWRHSPADRAKTPHALSSPPSAAAFGAIQ